MPQNNSRSTIRRGARGFRTAGALLLLLLCAGGCSDVDRSATWSRSQWKQDLASNQTRLTMEDDRQIGAMGKMFRGLGRLLRGPLDALMGQTPARAAANLQNTASPDLRREGIFYFADRPFGRRRPYLNRYAQIAENDPDYTVRAAALRALNRSRARVVSYPGPDRKFDTDDDVKVDLIPRYIESLEDKSDLVRLEAVKALANIPDERAVAPLIRHLEGRAHRPDPAAAAADTIETRDVRIAAADALRNFSRMDVAQALRGQLLDRDFGVAWQSLRSLRLMTGRNLAYDPDAWSEYLSRTSQPFASATG